MGKQNKIKRNTKAMNSGVHPWEDDPLPVQKVKQKRFQGQEKQKPVQPVVRLAVETNSNSVEEFSRIQENNCQIIDSDIEEKETHHQQQHQNHHQEEDLLEKEDIFEKMSNEHHQFEEIINNSPPASYAPSSTTTTTYKKKNILPVAIMYPRFSLEKRQENQRLPDNERKLCNSNLLWKKTHGNCERNMKRKCIN